MTFTRLAQLAWCSTDIRLFSRLRSHIVPEPVLHSKPLISAYQQPMDPFKYPAAKITRQGIDRPLYENENAHRLIFNPEPLIPMVWMTSDYKAVEGRDSLDAHLSPRDDPGIPPSTWPAMAHRYYPHTPAPSALASACQRAKLHGVRQRLIISEGLLDCKGALSSASGRGAIKQHSHVKISGLTG